MAKQDKDKTHLTREQMQRYLKGELSAREMHEVERVLMDSDFYADAAEGFELSRQAGVKTERVLTDLRHRLNERMKGHQRRKLLAWPAWSAAAGIVLAITGYFVIRYIEHENELKAMKASEAAIEEILSSIDNSDTRDTLKVLVPEPDEYLASYAAYRQADTPASAALQPGIAQRLRNVQLPAVDSEQADAVQHDKETADQAVTREQAVLKETLAESSGQEKQADADVLAKQAPAAAENRAYAKRALEQNTFRPQIITGKVLDEDDQPLPAYQKYLADSLRYPPQALENQTAGRVELSFRVDENGRPLDIRIEKSLGDGCDQEAIRLIREGPDFRVPGDGSRIKQSVVFKLPSKE